jgi:hypothetical protein
VNDPELAEQFKPQNIALMRSGSAPHARYQDAAGKRKTYELHHVVRVSEGGAVYDIENLRVSTPKNHIDIHRK